jgi:hypothetical protein
MKKSLTSFAIPLLRKNFDRLHAASSLVLAQFFFHLNLGFTAADCNVIRKSSFTLIDW